MESTKEIAKRFAEVILNGTWIANTNYKHQLDHLDWQTATAQVGNLNTIAALAQHVHYYIHGINQVFKGGTLDIKDQYSFDFPPITSQLEWEAFLSAFWYDAQEFAAWVDKMPKAQLSDVFVDEKYSTYNRNIQAMIEHSYYHLGQIVLIKKLLLEGIK
ncbi:DUF1572 domain-containing protein [Pedobacter nanyangensis]|uniref:DUF1572 domain-containing protein n=1 Tax=Pedobacter nanyangensis TaxID=1562389 RepID=UPI000DE3214C|nr:DUF1572 domain-containing protein [Pedobacter nanyangensis]